MTLTYRSTVGRRLTVVEGDGNIAHLADSSGVTFLQSGSGAVATTVQDKNRRVLDIFDFIPTALHTGIKDGTNSTDLSTYIQSAIDEAIASRRALDLSGYDLDIETGLVVRKASRLQVFGQGGNGGTYLCNLIWNGANGGTVLLLDQVRDSILRQFGITAGTGTIGVGIDIDAVGAVTVTPTHNRFRDVAIGASTSAVRISQTATANNDLHEFYDVYINGSGTSGYEIRNDQAKGIKLWGGSIDSRTKAVNVVNGSFTSYGTNFNANETDIYLDSPSDSILVCYPTGENSDRFIDAPNNTSAGYALTVLGGRIDPGSLHADGIFIRYHFRGALNLIGCDFASGAQSTTWKLEANSTGEGPVVNAIGVTFPNATPFQYAPSSHANVVFHQGCMYISDTGVSHLLPGGGEESVGVSAGSNGPVLELKDDFLGDVLADQWNGRVGSDPQCVAPAILANQQAGVMRMTTGDDAAADMATNGVQLESATNWRVDRHRLVMDIRVKIDAITNVAWFFGFTDQASALEMPFTLGAGDALTSNATDAVGVLFDTGADTDNWWLVGVAADVDATKQNAGSAPSAGAWASWRIEIHSGIGARFYLNGAQVGSTLASPVTVTALLTPVVAAFSRGAASRNVDADFIQVRSAR